METVGIRELKMHLSRHLKRVRAGARLLVTERGRSIATISPVDAPVDVEWAHKLVAEGHARWNGSKPAGELADKYSLRGFDSIHLASFAEVARRAGTDETRFSSFDEQLNRAARKLTRTLKRSQ